MSSQIETLVRKLEPIARDGNLSNGLVSFSIYTFTKENIERLLLAIRYDKHARYAEEIALMYYNEFKQMIVDSDMEETLTIETISNTHEDYHSVINKYDGLKQKVSIETVNGEVHVADVTEDATED